MKHTGPLWEREGGEEDDEELGATKARAELSVVPQVLRRATLRGRVVTGDALSCQRTLCRQIRQAQGHHLFVIKANQPELLAEVALLFAAPPPGERFPTLVSRRTKRDRTEVRTLTASAALGDYVQELGWVGARQVLRLESAVTSAGQTTQLVRYVVTSLGPHLPPRALLRLVREHGHSENRLHDVRDVTLGEDASQVRSGSAPQGCSLLCATPSSAYCASTGGATSLRRSGTSPGLPALPCTFLGSIPHNEKALR